MEKYSRATTIDYYLEKIISEKINLSDIRKELKKKNVEKEEINIITSFIDNKLIRNDIKKSNYHSGKHLLKGGLLLSIAGLLLTIGTYTNIIDFGSVYLIAYGPFFSGLFMIMKGKSIMNTNNNTF